MIVLKQNPAYEFVATCEVFTSQVFFAYWVLDAIIEMFFGIVHVDQTMIKKNDPDRLMN